MKTLLISAILGLTTTLALAQDVKTVKKAYDAKDYAKAQQAADAFVAKDDKKADAWFWKHKVYWAISENEQASKLVPNARKTGWQAIEKYASLDPQYKVAITDDILGYLNNFQNYYSKFITIGSVNLEAKNYTESVAAFKDALAVSTFFYDKKMITNALDTNITFYAGYAAMKGELKDDAELYYKKLADANAGGVDTHIGYGWLANYYLADKKDAKKALFYADKGLALYPTNDYLKEQKSFAIAASGDFAAISANHEADIAKPNAPFGDYLKYGIDLYGYLYTDTAAYKKPDFAAKQTKFDEVMNKAIGMKPNNAEANYIIGFHNANKALAIQTQLKAFKNKKLPADVAAKKKLEDAQLALVDASIKNHELAASIYKSKTVNIKENEKDNYKSTLANLINLYKYKNLNEKVKTYTDDMKAIK